MTSVFRLLRSCAVAGLALAAVTACVPVQGELRPEVVGRYAGTMDGGFPLAAVPAAYLTERNQRQLVAYTGPEAVGTVVVDPHARFLYLVTGPQRALRYGVAVGWAGRNLTGNATVQRKVAWPSWTPTANMIRTDPELYAAYARGLPPGPPNPLGARALYLYQGGKDTYYRIHGTFEMSAVGKATVAGCIRLFNQDAVDLFDRVPMGAPVKIRTEAESVFYEGVLREGPDGLLVQVAPPRT